MQQFNSIICNEPVPPVKKGRVASTMSDTVRAMKVGDSIKVDTLARAQYLRSCINTFPEGNTKATVRKRQSSDGRTYWQIWRVL